MSASSGSTGNWVGSAVGVCGANGEVAVTVGIPGAAPAPTPTFTPAGSYYATMLVGPDGTVLARGFWNECTEAPPAPPPSAAAVFAAAAMPRPVVVTSPPGPGLVGVENWFWYEGPTEQGIDVTLDGWRATTTARAVRFGWADYGSSSAPGSESDPAVRHVFERQGTYDITASVTWTAVFTFTGYGTTIVSPLPGEVTITGPTAAYPVQEREAVVVG